MQNSIDIGWLDIGILEDSRLAVLDSGRLQRVVAELSDPANQYPSLRAFLGGKAKSHALQQLYPLNNIKRHVSEAQIKLRYNVASLDSREPILLADGDIPHLEKFSPTKRLQAGVGIPVSWDNYSAGKMLLALWSRVIFIFADMICIFIDDTSTLEKVVQFLVNCLQLGSASPFPQSLLPRVIFIYGNVMHREETDMPDTDLLYCKIQNSGHHDLSGLFSGITFIYLQDDLSDTARFQRIRAVIAEQADAISFIRQEYQARPNGAHFTALFQLALRHTLHDIANPFDVMNATRKDRPVNPCAESHLAHYLEIGNRAQLQLRELAPSIASALFMDHYVPEMLATNPRVVFRTLYNPAVIQGYRRSKAPWLNACPAEQSNLVECHFSDLFKHYLENASSSVDLRRE